MLSGQQTTASNGVTSRDHFQQSTTAAKLDRSSKAPAIQGRHECSNRDRAPAENNEQKTKTADDLDRSLKECTYKFVDELHPDSSDDNKSGGQKTTACVDLDRDSKAITVEVRGGKTSSSRDKYNKICNQECIQQHWRKSDFVGKGQLVTKKFIDDGDESSMAEEMTTDESNMRSVVKERVSMVRL